MEITLPLSAKGDLSSSTGLLTAASSAPSQIVSPHWYALEPKLHDLTTVVRRRSTDLERTTTLTWMYRNKGFIEFNDIASRVLGALSRSRKRKKAMFAVQGLMRIGAVSTFQIEGQTETSFEDIEGLDDDPIADAEIQSELESASSQTVINGNTGILMTRSAMIWMERAWRARYINMDRRIYNISEIHACLLSEEEDGKGNEPFWLEDVYTPAHKESGSMPTGDATRWIAKGCSSIFDLGASINNSSAKNKHSS